MKLTTLLRSPPRTIPTADIGLSRIGKVNIFPGAAAVGASAGVGGTDTSPLPPALPLRLFSMFFSGTPLDCAAQLTP